MSETNSLETGSWRRLIVAVVALSLLAPAAASPVAAAGATSVSIAPADASVDVGESTTFEVVVDESQGGVGAAEIGVAVDSSVAEITGVEVLGPGATNTEIADDGSSVDLEYAFRDTADSGSVTVAEVTVQGVSDGTTDVSLEPTAGNDAVLIFDETGTGYDVTGTNDATLSVEGDEPTPDPASFQVSNLNAPDTTTQGDAIDVAADISNDGEQAATQTVEFRLDADGDGFGDDDDVVISEDVQLDPGESTTVEFTDVSTGGLDAGEYVHGVFTDDDSETTTLSVEEAEGPPSVGDFEQPPTDPDDDGLYEDVNGDGQFDIVDVQALFANLDDETVEDNPDMFDFNGDETLDVVDVQKLFTEVPDR
ncbi:CARDB domain-containing protein [Halorubrum sp. HHNYT27]|uniref:CARDB domain-containing protein n=1 Tax=Halorubrum sp. HHNYT27 TaxID=3402275 RepID=UPI003EBB90B4